MDESGEEYVEGEGEGHAPGQSSSFLATPSFPTPHTRISSLPQHSSPNDTREEGEGGKEKVEEGELGKGRESWSCLEEDASSSSSASSLPSSSKKKESSELSPVVEVKEISQMLSLLQNQKKHVFVLSEAGKPVYTRHGKEEDWVTLMGVMQALLSFVESRDDLVKYFRFKDWKFVFLDRKPLILVSASCSVESEAQLRSQLHFVHFQILSVLTKTQLTRIFETRKNYDLRRLLTGTEKSIHSLVDRSSSDPSLLLASVRSLPISSSVRENIGQALVSSANKVMNLVFAFLIAKGELVTMVRMKRFRVHPSDLHLLLNLIHCNPSFRNAQSWLPICLPRFDDTGFLHAHISYFSETSDLCLVMLTVDRNAFFTLSEVRNKIHDKLTKIKAFDSVVEAINAKHGVVLSEIGVSDLWHFIYKSRASAQLCMASYEPPYVNAEERQRLMDQYLIVIDRIFRNTEDSKLQPLRIFFTITDKEAILGWVTGTLELYAAFSPVVTKQSAISKVDKLIKWLRKEEDRLFICDKNLVLADSIG